MSHLVRVADRVFGRPLLIHPAKAEVIVAVLGERIGIDPAALSADDAPEAFKALRAMKPAANRLVGEPAGPVDARGRLLAVYYNLVNGVAVIPVVGTLVNRGAFIGEDGSGFTSYEGLAVQIGAALADPKVSAIMLDIDSPGGEATGMFSLAEMIRAARQQKPITALVNDMAASAAYGLASAASKVVVSPTSITGSIGVVMMHVDQSAEMQMKGRKPTFIHAGAHKVDGHPYGPLTDAVRADLQRDVNTFYDRFLETVAAGRPSLTIDALKKTEARTFIGAEAIALGLADSVGSFAETLSSMSAATSARKGNMKMSNSDNMISAADHTAAVSAARTEGEKAGAAAATARIAAILTCDEAKGREAQAQNLALSTDLSAEQAKALLATFPAADAAKAGAAKEVPSIAARAPAAVQADFPPQGTAEAAASKWGQITGRLNGSRH